MLTGLGNRRRGLRCFPLQRRGHHIYHQETDQPPVPPDLPARNWLQLAGLSRVLLSYGGQGPRVESRRHVVAHLRFCLAWPGPRRSQHVLYSSRNLVGHPWTYGLAVYLER